MIDRGEDSIQITADEVMRRVEESVRLACDFFDVGAEWKIRIRHGLDKAAENEMRHPYLVSVIRFDADYYCQHPEDIHAMAGHEVAHLVTAELHAAWLKMPDAWSKDGELGDTIFREALEKATVRLERVFLRFVPDPHPAPLTRGTA